MKSLNRCMFIGNVGHAPEIAYTSSGVAVAKFSIACNDSWKDSDGNKQEKTEWVNVVAWKKLAEICGQYLAKGSRVYVSGRLTTRSWDDKADGKKRHMTEIVADDMIMLNDNTAPQSDAEIDSLEKEPQKEDLPF